jgi:hypothetical protein
MNIMIAGRTCAIYVLVQILLIIFGPILGDTVSRYLSSITSRLSYSLDSRLSDGSHAHIHYIHAR